MVGRIQIRSVLARSESGIGAARCLRWRHHDRAAARHVRATNGRQPRHRARKCVLASLAGSDLPPGHGGPAVRLFRGDRRVMAIRLWDWVNWGDALFQVVELSTADSVIEHASTGERTRISTAELAAQ